MSLKFSFLVTINNGKQTTETFPRERTHEAKERFNEVRREGKEAYLYIMPLEDKRCKSSEQSRASLAGVKDEPQSAVEQFMTTAKTLVKPKRSKSEADLSI